MLIVGIDPGFEGAIAFLRPGEGVVSVHDMPTAPNAAGKTELDLVELGRLLTPTDERCIALLEYVAARPKQGAPSIFRFGQGFGAVQAFLSGHGWEWTMTTPAKWKKHYGLIDKDLTQSQKKKQSIAKAKTLFPDMAHKLTRVSKDDGRAEAMLIARFRFNTMNQHEKEAV